MGYYKRLGLTIPMGVLNSIVFVPGKTRDILTYGGLFSQARIVVPKNLVVFALGQPSFVTVDDDSLIPLDANEPLGRILPASLSKSYKSKGTEKKISKQLKKSKFSLTTYQTLSESSDSTSVPMEMSAGVWGQIRPNPGDSVGLVSNNLQDLQIVKELLQEHHIHFAKLQFDEEYDDTDPNSLDFMFGLLLREVGKVHRRESLLFTFFLSLSRYSRKLKGKLRDWTQKITEYYDANLSKPYHFIADSYVCLNQGRHHLTQLIYMQLTGDTSHLTKRSSYENLFSTSELMFNEIEKIQPSHKDEDRFRATYLNRSIWISDFFAFDIKKPKYKKTKPILPMTILTAFILVIILEFVSAAQFFEVFKERYTKFQNDLVAYEEEQGARNGK